MTRQPPYLGIKVYLLERTVCTPGAYCDRDYSLCILAKTTFLFFLFFFHFVPFCPRTVLSNAHRPFGGRITVATS